MSEEKNKDGYSITNDILTACGLTSGITCIASAIFGQFEIAGIAGGLTGLFLLFGVEKGSESESDPDKTLEFNELDSNRRKSNYLKFLPK